MIECTTLLTVAQISHDVGRARLSVLDWLVIVGYMLGMLAIGWYYSSRSKTADDYLLGGRNMKPWAVGLSLFATLFSTISYLAWPGEMIRHGPMILASLVAYPVIAAVVGWLMIPFFMKLRVTSAYEILETRLGLSVRMLGCTFFLLMRLLWMAVIIYTTIANILVPLTGLDPAYTPYLCAVLGLITVAYSSAGGLPAVVTTDVIQTVILFGGAILTIAVIAGQMGGLTSWWPTHWPSHWQPPKFGYDPTARITFLSAFIATFTWYTCTAGSDQMAIQRYLATRDAPAARRMFIISLASGAAVMSFLTILGLALLAYYQANPLAMPPGQTLISHPDQLFPRFIVSGLPTGISGLVIAGLLAAAMSSLSSGISSSCSVITVDFIDRFRKTKESPTDHVRLAKYVSWCVGLTTIVMTFFVGAVKGNLLEIAFKVVNLLTAPLFGLFFMAMFVPWATAAGSLVGAVCGVGVVVAINYWEELTGAPGISFLWAMPLGLVAQIASGALISLFLGRPIPRLNPAMPLDSSESSGLVENAAPDL